MLYCISGIVSLQLNILLMCIKSVGRIAYYHRGHIALKHGSDWNIPMSEFHLAKKKGISSKLSAILRDGFEIQTYLSCNYHHTSVLLEGVQNIAVTLLRQVLIHY